jgi:hypothetical protein
VSCWDSAASNVGHISLIDRTLYRPGKKQACLESNRKAVEDRVDAEEDTQGGDSTSQCSPLEPLSSFGFRKSGDRLAAAIEAGVGRGEGDGGCIVGGRVGVEVGSSPSVDDEVVGDDHCEGEGVGSRDISLRSMETSSMCVWTDDQEGWSD